MKRFLLTTVIASGLVLAACVDTTGLSGESTRTPRGNINAAVVVTDYADFQCPACIAAYQLITKPLFEKYGSQVKFEFKHFPLRSIHQFAMDIAEASECAADQGKFWEYEDLAFSAQATMNEEGAQLTNVAIRGWAEQLGLDMDIYDRCTKSHIKREAILKDYDQGVAAGVQGTPTYMVNGQKVTSELQAISAAIDTALTGAATRL